MEAQEQTTDSRLQDQTQTQDQSQCDHEDPLVSKVGFLETRLSRVSVSNSELCTMLLQSEEERLRLSKELVKEKLQSNNRMDTFEEELLHLNEKLLTQSSAMVQLQAERDALRRQLEEQRHRGQATSQDLHQDLDHVRTLVTHMVQNTVKPEDLAALDKVQKTLGENLLVNQDEMKSMIENLRRAQEEQQKQRQRTEKKVLALDTENQLEVVSKQKKLIQQKETTPFSQRQTRELEQENSELQLELKELNEEYRARLNCYIQDLAEYMDGLEESKKSPNPGQMQLYVERMLRDIRSSFRCREQQLASAARVYKKRLQTLSQTHHALIIAYRNQREEILAKPESGLKAGPPESSFDLDPSELTGEMGKELQQLRKDKARLDLQLQTTMAQAPPEAPQKCGESWSDIRTQLTDMTETALRRFEKERVLLLTRAAAAEAQVSEMQEFIDKQQHRYNKEAFVLSNDQVKPSTSTN
uniref:DUF4472 domain-containing protein n=1 Tax=Knipowitschia caucasica TaxID=637954 RepID=A0AAV2LI25_KNICA